MSNTAISDSYLQGLNSKRLLLELTWYEWLAIEPPYADRKFTTAVVLVPWYGHVGEAELHNEKIAYLWLWAYKSGYFDQPIG